MGSRSISPMVAKQQAADARERRIELRQPRSDGFLRRTEKEAIDAHEHSLASRRRKVFVNAWQMYQHERFIRNMLTKRGDAASLAKLATREDVLPIAAAAPGGTHYKGVIIPGDKVVIRDKSKEPA